MTSYRSASLAAGVLYLLTFISIPTLSLYTAVHHPDYITGPGPDMPVFIGGILEIIVAITGIGTAVALYPVLKKQNEGLALGLVGSRVLEASTIFAGVAFLLAVVTLRQSGAGPDALPSARALVTMYDRMFLVGQSFMPAVNDFLLGILLYRSRLVPRGLALIGALGAFALVAGDLAILFGVVQQRDPSTFLAAVPVAFFEFGLGLWLVVKGFDATALNRLTTEVQHG